MVPGLVGVPLSPCGAWSPVPVVWSVGLPGPAPGGVWWGGLCPPRAVGRGFAPPSGRSSCIHLRGSVTTSCLTALWWLRQAESGGQDAPHENWGVSGETSGDARVDAGVRPATHGSTPHTSHASHTTSHPRHSGSNSRTLVAEHRWWGVAQAAPAEYDHAGCRVEVGGSIADRRPSSRARHSRGLPCADMDTVNRKTA